MENAETEPSPAPSPHSSPALSPDTSNNLVSVAIVEQHKATALQLRDEYEKLMREYSAYKDEAERIRNSMTRQLETLQTELTEVSSQQLPTRMGVPRSQVRCE